MIVVPERPLFARPVGIDFPPGRDHLCLAAGLLAAVAATWMLTRLLPQGSCLTLTACCRRGRGSLGRRYSLLPRRRPYLLLPWF